MSEPERLGRYTLQGELGRGAMGIVYRASDAMLNRTVAIKTINVAADPAEREEYEKRFYQEARAAGGLSHPNIVTIYDIGNAGDVVYMAMEFVQGSELTSLLDGRVVDPAQALDIGAQIADGLAYAHERGVVHRDVKPANIMVERGGRAKIMDFGIARMRSSDVKTQTGILLGSPKYMAPEQLLGRGVDHRCDIFALGVVLYEMAAGVPPFSGDDITQIMYRIVHSNPPAPSAVNARLPAILDLVLARALAKDPDARYQSAAELAADLRAARVQLLAAMPPRGQEDKTDEEDDASQTLPIGSLSLPPREEKTPARALAPEQIPARPDPQPKPQTGPPPKPERAEPGARLRISRRFDSTEAMRRLAASSGDAFERTVKLDFAALGASSEPPALGGPQPAAPLSGSSAAPPATQERGGRERFGLWASVTIAALVALVIALG